MNRLTLSTLLAVSLLAAFRAIACGPFYIEHDDLVLYKLGDAPLWECAPTPAEQRTRDSRLAWCRQAGKGVTPDDVAEVMGYSQDRLEHPDRTSHNAFERWLARHDDAHQYLVLAKHCERTREYMGDPWWYPESDDGQHLLIEEIEEEARRHAAAEVQGRYAVLAVRAMVTQRKWKQCLDYWDSVQSTITCPAVRNLVIPELVGCRYHLGDSVGALRYYMRDGDLRSAQMCCRQMGIDLLDVATANPELPIFQDYLNEHLMHADQSTSSSSGYGEGVSEGQREQWRRQRETAVNVARQRPANAAMWLYAAAALSNALDEGGRAEALCRQALKARGHHALDDRTRVLLMAVRCRTMPVGREYERMLFRGMKDLARLSARDMEQLKHGLDNDFAEEYYPTDAAAINEYLHDTPCYYWHNMLRRIVAGEAAPRLVEAGRGALALMACNAAENLTPIHAGVDSCVHRYSGAMFALADTLPLADVSRYYRAMNAPASDFERWLVANSQTDGDYWNELLGTRHLREMDYAGAVDYFSKVSRDYQEDMNVWIYFDYAPMRHQRVRSTSRHDYKLRYARAMLAAEQAIESSDDPNARASAMMRLAIGLDNAVGRDWALLRYGTGWPHSVTFGQSNEAAIARQLQRSQRLLKAAFDTFTDNELAAEWRVEMGQYRKAVELYPETSTARRLTTHCDELKHYAMK